MTNQELYKQAILDAKAVRETALAAAKQSLSEAFEPRIMEMMRLKLSEELEEGETEMEESMKDNMEESMGGMPEEGAQVDETVLDEILAELDELSTEMEENAELEEGHVKQDGYVGTKGKGGTGYPEKDHVSHGDKKLHEADEEDEDTEEEAPEGDETDGADDSLTGGGEDGPVSDDDEVVELTVGELKNIVRDAFMQFQGGAATDSEMGAMEPGTDEEGGMMDMGGAPEEMEEISLEEILAELEKESNMEESTGPGSYQDTKSEPKGGSQIEEKKKMQMEKDLKQANEAVKAMRNELNEVNLLNAKLLYFNKILKAKSLNESQKVKAMNAFDRATNVKEVENTYRTLSEAITAAPKKAALKESMSFASKPIGNAPAKPIVEADAFVNRWQVLAGIK